MIKQNRIVRWFGASAGLALGFVAFAAPAHADAEDRALALVVGAALGYAVASDGIDYRAVHYRHAPRHRLPYRHVPRGIHPGFRGKGHWHAPSRGYGWRHEHGRRFDDRIRRHHREDPRRDRRHDRDHRRDGRFHHRGT